MDNSRSDAELFRRCIEGDESAFVLLYGRLKHNIFRYAYYMTGSNFAAEEITQEVFMTLLSEGGKYRERRGDVAAFAFGITKNLVRRMRRHERSFEPLPEDSAMLEKLVSGPDSVSAHLVSHELAERVQMAVASLPLHYREAVVLCDLCEISYSQAATRLGCSVGTIRSRLNRAHNILARKLKPLQRTRAVGLTGSEGCLI